MYVYYYYYYYTYNIYTLQNCYVNNKLRKVCILLVYIF